MNNGYTRARDRMVFWWGVSLGMVVGVPLFAVIVLWA